MTTKDSQSLDELIPLTEDAGALSGKDAEPHPFALREDLEPWQRRFEYDPALRLGRPKERRARGKALRERSPFEGHASWKAHLNRPDPLQTVAASNVGRQEHLIPLRMGRMAASPFAFLRGSAGVMAADLAQTPVTGLQVMVCGDAHLSNFGLLGTPERSVVFDLNDFDEVTYGSWEWDLERLVASVNVAGRENGRDRGDRREAVAACVSGYRDNARRLQALPILEVWYLHHYPGKEKPVFKPDANTKKVLEKAVKKASQRDNAAFFRKVAHRSENGAWRFKDQPPILKRLDESTAAKVIQSLIPYAQTISPHREYMLQHYHVADVAHRVVGVGSVGTRAYVVMLFGNDESDPLFIQVKEAMAPAFAPYTPPLPPELEHQGRRVVLGQRLLQAATDVLLGWTSIDGRPFFVRQMRDLKGSIDIEWLKGSAFVMYARACGTLLARAHARSGDIAKIAGYCGKSEALDEAMADFAEAYGNQVEQDHDALVKAIAAGKIPAETGI